MLYALIALLIVNLVLAGLGFGPWRSANDSITQREIQAEALILHGPSSLTRLPTGQNNATESPVLAADLASDQAQSPPTRGGPTTTVEEAAVNAQVATPSESAVPLTAAVPTPSTSQPPTTSPPPSGSPAPSLPTPPDASPAAAPSLPTLAQTSSAQVVTAPAFCAEWGPFSRDQFQEVAAWVENRFAQAEIFSRLISSPAGWMVYVPPAATMQQSAQRAAALRSSGIDELFVVQETGPLRGAISLGVFRSEEAAQRLLAERQRQGISDARIMPREAVERVWMRLNDATIASWIREQVDAAGNLPAAMPAALEWRDC